MSFDINTIQGIRHLLSRVDLKGSEVPAFNRIMVDLETEERRLLSNQVQQELHPISGKALSAVE